MELAIVPTQIHKSRELVNKSILQIVKIPHNKMELAKISQMYTYIH